MNVRDDSTLHHIMNANSKNRYNTLAAVMIKEGVYIFADDDYGSCIYAVCETIVMTWDIGTRWYFYG